MKKGLVFFIVLFSLYILKAQHSVANLNIKYKSIPLCGVLDSLSEHYNFFFSYNSTQPVFKKNVTFNYQGRIEHLLDTLSSKFNLKYQYVNGIYVLSQFNSGFKELAMFSKIVRGHVIDSTNQEPLQFAIVNLIGTNQSIFTNEDGYFRLKLNNLANNDSLKVSLVGYHSKVIPIPKDSMVWISLERQSILIDTLVIRYYNPIHVIESFQNNVRYNYTRYDQFTKAFFRESTLMNGEYQYVCEALIQIQKSSYFDPIRRDKAWIVRGRKTNFGKQDKMIHYRLEGSINNTMLLDVVKFRADFLDPIFSMDFKYTYVKTIWDNGQQLVEIKFQPLDDSNNSKYEGSMWFDINNFALVAVDFGLTSSGLEQSRKTLIKKHSKYLSVNPVMASYRVTFSEMNGSYSLNSAMGRISLEVKGRYFSSTRYYQSTMEMIVTELDSINSIVDQSVAPVKANETMSERIDDFHPQYWNENNYIVPGEKLNNALTRFIKGIK